MAGDEAHCAILIAEISETKLGTAILEERRQKDHHSMNTQYQRKSDVIAADMGGETVMLSVSTGKYFGLSGIGQIVWGLMAEPIAIDEMVSAICLSHNVDEVTCRKDCEAFLDDLVRQGLASLI